MRVFNMIVYSRDAQPRGRSGPRSY